MNRIVGPGEAVGLAVDDEVDAVLAPARDILGAMFPGARKAECLEQRFEELDLALVGGEFDELHIADPGT